VRLYLDEVHDGVAAALSAFRRSRASEKARIISDWPGIAACAARRTGGTALICRRKSAHQKNL